ncbi:hypothetical protein CTI12_AA504520 [Artemisia annua]|uniref:Helitron helicase-like domain-containing protein n=1 Tax=Artemisia annua TaxID=35608 RepID=A0A2U1LDB7_ARTAN|nr:hypothetical protein CTI12_AA504520 [Artemisia annua]
MVNRRTKDVTPSTSNDAMNKKIPIIVISDDEESAAIVSMKKDAPIIVISDSEEPKQVACKRRRLIKKGNSVNKKDSNCISHDDESTNGLSESKQGANNKKCDDTPMSDDEASIHFKRSKISQSSNEYKHHKFTLLDEDTDENMDENKTTIEDDYDGVWVNINDLEEPWYPLEEYKPKYPILDEVEESTQNGGTMIDLTIRHGGKRPVQRIGVQTVEQFQKRKPGRQPTTHTINQPSDHSRLLLIQETLLQPRGQYVYCDAVQDNQMAPRPRGRPRNDSTKKHYIDHGNPIYKCRDCNALLWQSESMVGSTHMVNGSYSLCCGRGKVMLRNEIVNPPPLLLDLISGNNPKSSSFIDNIRRYNSVFAFTSIGANIDETITSETNDLDHELTVELRDMLDSINPLVAQFRMAGEQFASAKNRNKLKLHLIDYVDHGNPIYKCGDCNALLWQSESMVGSTHTVNGSYSLCCGRGKVMLRNEIVNPPPLLLDLISGNNPKSTTMKRQHQKPMI